MFIIFHSIYLYHIFISFINERILVSILTRQSCRLEEYCTVELKDEGTKAQFIFRILIYFVLLQIYLVDYLVLFLVLRQFSFSVQAPIDTWFVEKKKMNHVSTEYWWCFSDDLSRSIIFTALQVVNEQTMSAKLMSFILFIEDFLFCFVCHLSSIYRLFLSNVWLHTYKWDQFS